MCIRDRACLVDGVTEGIKFKTKQASVMAAQLCFTENQANAILDMRLYKLCLLYTSGSDAGIKGRL